MDGWNKSILRLIPFVRFTYIFLLNVNTSKENIRKLLNYSTNCRYGGCTVEAAAPVSLSHLWAESGGTVPDPCLKNDARPVGAQRAHTADRRDTPP